MLLAAVVALAGALVGLVGTGALLRRLFDSQELFLLSWTAALLAFTAALGGEAIGCALGFDATTFRAVMVGGGLLGPLWLAWGVVELAGPRIPVMFATRLVVVVLTIVPGVVLAADPVQGRFGTTVPQPSAHYLSLPMTLLRVGLVCSAATFVVVFAVAALGSRRRDPRFPVIALTCGAGLLAVLAGAFPLPSFSGPAALAATVGLAWFGGVRGAGLSEDVEPEAGADDDAESFDDGGASGYPSTDPSAARTAAFAAAGAGAADAGGAFAESDPGAPAPEPYGMISLVTLMDGKSEQFDRLAAQVVEDVRREEPDTLVFACHEVPSAPLQRIFYELYRDRAAYEEHRRRSHIRRFHAEREPYVLATNVIELRLTAGKTSALPGAFGLASGR